MMEDKPLAVLFQTEMSSVSSSAYGAGDSDSSRTLAKRPRKNERARRERLRKRYIEMIEEMTSQQLDFTDRSLVDNVQRDLKQSTGDFYIAFREY